MPDKTAIRDAATVIVLRDNAAGPSVLMGQRGAGAAFLPGKFVFPGGAVDPSDQEVPVPGLSAACIARLRVDSALAPGTLAAAAIRELWEETGQILGHAGPFPDPPADWQGFAATGHRPDAAGLAFFFRAVTPKGRPRRFDARFFLVPAVALASDPDDFTAADAELSHLQWVPLAEARSFDLPFITQIVLAELSAHLARGGPIKSVPFVRNDDPS